MKPKNSEAIRRTHRNLGYASGLAGRPCEHPENPDYANSWRRGKERAAQVAKESERDA